MPTEEFTSIKLLLAQGRFAEAEAALDAALARSPDEHLLHAHRAALWLERGDFPKAHERLTDARDRAKAAADIPAQAFAELWLGYLKNRTKAPAEAVGHFEAAAALEAPSADLCGALCQTYMSLNDRDRALPWGEKSLHLRSTEFSCPPAEMVKPERPHSFDPSARTRNVISFSLFGTDTYYQECAITVARTARALFPEFTCWFYCSPDIPVEVKRLLSRNGAKVLEARVPKETAHPFTGLLLRFLPFDDPDVDLVLVRDVDGPLTLRERIAIDHWLAGDRPFLSIRDHVQHSEPLMAGMWGGYTGLLPNLGAALSRFRPPGNSRYIDQLFLRQFIWPRIREATLALDSTYSYAGSEPFPTAADLPGSRTVGSAWLRNQILR